MATSVRSMVVVAMVVITTVLGGFTASASAASAAAAAEDTATIFFVQGLPAAVIDVAVDGQRWLRVCRPPTCPEPFTVSAGTRTLTFTDANGKVVVQNTVDARPARAPIWSCT